MRPLAVVHGPELRHANLLGGRRLEHAHPLFCLLLDEPCDAPVIGPRHAERTMIGDGRVPEGTGQSIRSRRHATARQRGATRHGAQATERAAQALEQPVPRLGLGHGEPVLERIAPESEQAEHAVLEMLEAVLESNLPPWTL